MSAEIVTALEKAASPVQNQRQAGEQELQSLEAKTGFRLQVLRIFNDEQVSMSNRYLAIIYLKNAVEKRWRRPAHFPAEEKEALRTELLASTTTPMIAGSRQMTKQLAVTIAAIARIDFPRNWPNLLTELNQKIIDLANAGDVDRLQTVLETMHQSLKRLGTARIGQARVQFRDFSVSQIELYWQLFASYQSYTALKIVGTLLYDGHERAHRFSGPINVFACLFPKLQDSINDSKMMRRIVKIYERLVEKCPRVFCGFGENAQKVADFYCHFLSTQSSVRSSVSYHSETQEDSTTILQAMRITRDIIRIMKSQSRPERSLPLNLRSTDDLDRKELAEAYVMLAPIFEESKIVAIVDVLVQVYFRLTAEDVELWREEPAEFAIEESRQNAEFSTTLCAELLFAQILASWPDQVSPRAQLSIEQAVQSGDELSIEGALRALEFGAATFSDSFEIAPIIQMLSSQMTSPLIRRRILLVISGWIPVSNDKSLPTMAFNLVNSTLEGDWDIVVQLGCLELVRVCCDDIDFQPHTFAEAAQNVFKTIYFLLRSSSQPTEIKIHVLKVLGAVIEGLGPRMNIEETSQILEILPALWVAETESSNHHLVQGAVLQTLSQLTSSCGSTTLQQVDRIYSVSLPLIDIATDPSQPLSQYLLDDGLSLWKGLLVIAPQDAAGLLAPLFERLMLLIETKTEELGVLLSILESYLWLDCSIAVPHFNKIFALFSLYLADGCALDEALVMLLCTEVALMLIGIVGRSGQVHQSLQQTGLLNWMQACVINASSEDVPMDILIQAGKCINNLSLVSVQSSGRAISNPHALFPAWLNKIRGISDPRDRKLAGMGVTALFLTYPDIFKQYAAHYIEIISALVEEIPDSSEYSRFYTPRTQVDNGDVPFPEELRQQAARESEIAVSVGLQAFIKEVAEQVQQVTGQSELLSMTAQMGII